MNMLSAMAHDESIYQSIENQLNSLIKTITSNGGAIWIQSKDNKEHYYKLDGEITIGSCRLLTK